MSAHSGDGGKSNPRKRLLLVAARVRRPGPRAVVASARQSRTMRFLQSRRLVVALGVSLYIVPSPIYMGAVNAIADTNASSGQQLVYLAEMLVLMLWLIEVPMLMLIALPEHHFGAGTHQRLACESWTRASCPGKRRTRGLPRHRRCSGCAHVMG